MPKKIRIIKLSFIGYMAVRNDNYDGRQWVDTTSISATEEMARIESKSTDDQIPQWAKDNPVVRIGKFNIEEI